jgi:hypothetical protein
VRQVPGFVRYACGLLWLQAGIWVAVSALFLLGTGENAAVGSVPHALISALAGAVAAAFGFLKGRLGRRLTSGSVRVRRLATGVELAMTCFHPPGGTLARIHPGNHRTPDRRTRSSSGICVPSPSSARDGLRPRACRISCSSDVRPRREFSWGFPDLPGRILPPVLSSYLRPDVITGRITVAGTTETLHVIQACDWCDM